MCVSKLQDRCMKVNRNNIERAVCGVLVTAKVERRLICGLLQAIQYLDEKADDALVCLLPQTRPGDATTHILTVLLQAFCYENFIPVIMVDNSERLAKLCGMTPDQKGATCTCAIVSKGSNNNFLLSPSEKKLWDFYECTIEEIPRPVIQLPI